MVKRGSFDITMESEPPYDDVDGVNLSRATFDKRFSGALVGTSKVHMLGVRTPVKNSAGYVAVERISGTLEGRSGTFVAAHMGIMTEQGRSLTISIVPDSGTGELVGLSGRMKIEIVEGKHFYEIDYTLEGR